ncbi:MAG: nuclease-related domain-containing protein [Bacillota bacterium]
MAEIIKSRTESNFSPQFMKVNQQIKVKKATKQRKISSVLFSISFAFFIGYCYEVSSYYNYFLYPGMLFFIIFLCNGSHAVTGLQSYQNYTSPKSNSANKCRGDEGEDEFIKKVVNILKDSDFRVINNLYFAGNNDYLRQIDSLIIGRKNLYVIEVKKWRGLIVGTSTEQNWKIYNGNYKGSRRNPYLQNKQHVIDVKKLVGDLLPAESQIYNVVINMERDAIFNVRDKYRTKIYDNWYDLLYWIKYSEDKEDKSVFLKQPEEIIERLMDNHYIELCKSELKINQVELYEFNLYNMLSQGIIN